MSGNAHAAAGDESHLRDAAPAVVEFRDQLKGEFATRVNVAQPREVFSLAGAALLWAGAPCRDPELLRRETLVVKPRVPFSGTIRKSEDLLRGQSAHRSC